MTPEQQRIAIAKACGWTAEQDSNGYWRAVNKKHGNAVELWLSEQNVWSVGIPDYLNDLNAMHKAKKILSDSQKRKWGELCVEMTNDFPQHIVLYCKNSVSGENIYTVANLTAAQEAELLLKTLGLWEEEE